MPLREFRGDKKFGFSLWSTGHSQKVGVGGTVIQSGLEINPKLTLNRI